MQPAVAVAVAVAVVAAVGAAPVTQFAAPAAPAAKVQKPR